MPKSEVVRAAIAEYHDKLGRLSERERLTMLRAFDDLISKIPGRSAAEADRELSPFDARVPPAVVCVVIGSRRDLPGLSLYDPV